MKSLPINFWGNELMLDKHFSLRTAARGFPLEKFPQRLHYSILGIVTKGSSCVEIDSIRYLLQEGIILSVFPMQILELIKEDNDLEVTYFTCSETMLNKILFHFPTEFELFLKECPTYNTPEMMFARYRSFFEILHESYMDFDNVCRNEIIFSYVRCFFLEIYNNLQHELLKNPDRNPRRKELMKKFISLIAQNYKLNREVAFYADKLNITPKYLSVISLQTNGKPAKRIIDDYIVTEIKLMLKVTTQSIQEISGDFNFPDQSFMCKYFKKHTGLSPKQYRMN